MWKLSNRSKLTEDDLEWTFAGVKQINGIVKEILVKASTMEVAKI